MLKNKRILLGVTGSIAAYKAALLARLFVQAGAEVRVVMTEAACRFVTPLTFSTLSRHAVLTDLWSGEWTEHIHLAEWADVMVIAPCTANTIADMAAGNGNNALLAVWLAARCPVLVAPAMDAGMYRHPAVQRNLRQLAADGVFEIPPSSGFLASGLEGIGRLAEPEEIVSWTIRALTPSLLSGKHILITAGPTREPLDPVRYLTNGSSGRMGTALAAASWHMGASVTLIHGPMEAAVPTGVTPIPVQTAIDMFNTVQEQFQTADMIICCAAVSDYRPQNISGTKLKKENGTPEIHLIENPDILAWCGKNKQVHQRIIGFALESMDGDNAATSKLQRKQADAIVLNYAGRPDEGIAADTNHVRIFFKNGRIHESSTALKQEIAGFILNTVLEEYPF